MKVSWEELAKADLSGRDLIEEDKHSNRIWRGPISKVVIEGRMAGFERAWTAISFDGGSSYQLCEPVPAGVSISEEVRGSLNGEMRISIPGISWTICALGNHLARPTA